MSLFDVDELYTDNGIAGLVSLFERNDIELEPAQMRILLEDFSSEQLGLLIDDAVFGVFKSLIFDDEDDETNLSENEPTCSDTDYDLDIDFD